MQQENQKAREEELLRQEKREDDIGNRFAVAGLVLVAISCVLLLVSLALEIGSLVFWLTEAPAIGCFLAGLALLMVNLHFMDIAHAIHVEWEELVGQEEIAKRHVQGHVRHWSRKRQAR